MGCVEVHEGAAGEAVVGAPVDENDVGREILDEFKHRVARIGDGRGQQSGMIDTGLIGQFTEAHARRHTERGFRTGGDEARLQQADIVRIATTASGIKTISRCI